MKIDFVQPRFTGARFEQNTLPVEVARDLVAYETLIVELAKHLYLQEHPDRQRVPKGFASDFHLHIERIDPGSAKPMLALVAATAIGLFTGDNAYSEQSYFDRAKSLVSECIAADDGALPTSFPKELLAHFNQLGRSLREGEALELPRASITAPAILTPDRRKKLVLAADEVYEREVELTGAITEVDWDKSTFRMRLEDGAQVTVPMPMSFSPKAREFGGRPRHHVCMKGIVLYDSWDRLQKIVAVESLEILQNHQIATTFEYLSQLEDGWDGDGSVAPDADKLATVGLKLGSLYPEKLPIPAVVPTQEGNLLLEWQARGDPSLDISLSDMSASFHSFADGQEDIERDFDLTDDSGWPQLFAFLSDHIKQRSA